MGSGKRRRLRRWGTIGQEEQRKGGDKTANKCIKRGILCRPTVITDVKLVWEGRRKGRT